MCKYAFFTDDVGSLIHIDGISSTGFDFYRISYACKKGSARELSF